MRGDVFFDTNVIVYAFDETEPEKREIASKLLYEIFKGDEKGAVSNQVLLELFLVLTGKIKKMFTKEMASNVVEYFILSENWEKIDYSHKTIQNALNLVEKHNVSMLDAVLISTALENNITTIFTEDEKEFSKVPGLKVVNPFK
jgi:predicted nucleic acid-binding protein